MTNLEVILVRTLEALHREVEGAKIEGNEALNGAMTDAGSLLKSVVIPE